MNIVKNIYSNIVSKFNSVKTKISTILSSTKEVIFEIFNKIKTSLGNVITKIVDGVKQKFNSLKNGITTIFTNIKNSVVNIFKNIKTNLVNIVSKMWSAIKSKFSALGTAMGNAISGAVKTAVNWILNKIETTINNFFKLINSGIDIINKIPEVNIKKLSMISIPKLARGGIVNQPTQAIIGEAGKEAVLPLENNTEWMDILAEKIATILGNNSSNTEPKQIIFQFEKTTSQFVRALKPKLDEESRRKGYKLVIVGGNNHNE